MFLKLCVDALWIAKVSKEMHMNIGLPYYADALGSTSVIGTSILKIHIHAIPGQIPAINKHK